MKKLYREFTHSHECGNSAILLQWRRLLEARRREDDLGFGPKRMHRVAKICTDGCRFCMLAIA